MTTRRTCPSPITPSHRLWGTLLLGAAVSLGCGSNSDEKYELTVSHIYPEGNGLTVIINSWAQQLAERSEGRIVPKVHSSAELLAENEQYDGVRTGIADVVFSIPEPSFKLNTVLSLPFLGLPPQPETGQLYKDLLEDIPEFRDEWDKVEVLSVMMMPPMGIHNKLREVRTLADVETVRLLGANDSTVAALDAAGAFAVRLDVEEMTPALAEDRIDGVINSLPTLQVFGALNLLPYHTVFGEGGISQEPIIMMMNTDVFHNLPGDLQKLIVDSGVELEQSFYAMDAGFAADVRQAAESLGHTFTELTVEEVAVWYDLVKQPIHDAWIAEAEAHELPGTEVYEYVLEHIEAGN